jgi:hypothetical protein
LAQLKPFALTYSDQPRQAVTLVILGVGRKDHWREERAGDGDQRSQISRRSGEHG